MYANSIHTPCSKPALTGRVQIARTRCAETMWLGAIESHCRTGLSRHSPKAARGSDFTVSSLYKLTFEPNLALYKASNLCPQDCSNDKSLFLTFPTYVFLHDWKAIVGGRDEFLEHFAHFDDRFETNNFVLWSHDVLRNQLVDMWGKQRW